MGGGRPRIVSVPRSRKRIDRNILFSLGWLSRSWSLCGSHRPYRMSVYYQRRFSRNPSMRNRCLFAWSAGIRPHTWLGRHDWKSRSRRWYASRRRRRTWYQARPLCRPGIGLSRSPPTVFAGPLPHGVFALPASWRRICYAPSVADKGWFPWIWRLWNPLVSWNVWI